MTSLHRFRAAHLAIAALPCGVLLTMLGVASCGGGSGNDGPAPSDSGPDASSNDALGDVASDAPPLDAKIDAGADTPPAITCSANPSYADPLRLNHSPDALRPIQNAAIAPLPDGHIMVVFLEALDTSGRFGLFARTVDPTQTDPAKAIGADDRLDVDADSLTSQTTLDLARLPSGALVLTFAPSPGTKRLRVYSHAKWSPEIGASMPLDGGDAVGSVDATNGTVLVTRARGSAPFGQAVVYKPDEGGTFGSWTTPQTLDLAAAATMPTLSSWALPDGRFVVAVWQESGGPAVVVRTISGAWSAPSERAEIGAIDASPSLQLLDDGTLVLASLEGTGDTRRVVTSTWTITGQTWTTARLLSKLGDQSGVIPFVGGRSDPFLFGVDAAPRTQAEFVAWVAACTDVAANCQFHPVSRRFVSGDWQDGVDLAIGTPANGADGLQVAALDALTPLVSRTAIDGTQIQLSIRSAGAKAFSAIDSILTGSPLFDPTIRASARFFGGDSLSTWAIASRSETDDAGTNPTASALAKIDPVSSSPPVWSAIVDGAQAKLQGFAYFIAYVDGAGGFTVATNSAFDDSGSIFPVITHATSPVAVEIERVLLSDESNATFFAGPRYGPRPGLDKSILVSVLANPSSSTGGPGQRLRAYAWNGIGAVSPKLLSDESKSPRSFGEGILANGCGGAILYAEYPPSPLPQALNLVVVK